MKPKLYKRANGYWYIKLSEGSKLSLGTKDKQEATRIFNLKVAQMREGKLAALDKVKRIRLSELKEEFMAHREKLLTFGEISKDTLKNNEISLRRFIELVGDIPVRMVNRGTIEQFKDKLMRGAADKDKRRQTILDYMANISVAFTYAALEDQETGKAAYIARNPFLKEPGKKSVRFALRERLPRFLTLDDIKAMRDKSDEHLAELKREQQIDNDPWRQAQLADQIEAARLRRLLFEIGIHTGLRRKDMFGLKWQDIDLESRYLRVEKTKTGDDRSVPIHEDLYKALIEFGPKDIGRVFQKWQDVGTLTKQFKKLARRAGVDENKTLHSTKHTLGSWAAMSGVDLGTIKELLGHKHISTTMIYAKVSATHQQQQLKKVNYGGNDGEKTGSK